MKTRSVLVVAAVLAAFMGGMMVQGAPSKPKKKKKAEEKVTFKETYEAGVKLAEARNYRGALKKFLEAEKLEENNPDALNMIGFTNRKLGRLEIAFEYYTLALERRNRFPEAREYLAEAHLQAALLQARELERYGSSGEEQLDALRVAFQKAAEAVTGDEDLSKVDLRRW